MRLIAPTISIVLALALAGAVWLFYSEHEKNREQADQIAKLKTDIADKSDQQSFDLKRKCATEADRFFKYWENESNKISLIYRSHYNPRLKTCFVLIQDNDMANNYLDRSLFDAVDKRQYADFTSEGLGKNMYVCSLSPPDGEHKDCNTKAEFDTFVASYMESASDQPF